VTYVEAQPGFWQFGKNARKLTRRPRAAIPLIHIFYQQEGTERAPNGNIVDCIGM